jgi:anaerobic ribonucleoside-triphosphate reductase
MNDMSVITEAHSAITLKDEERTRCEVWTRVMGYHRPVTSFNKGKQSEHRERQFFVEGRCTPG